MLTNDMIAILEKQRLGFVATVSMDGKPNLSPKGTFVVVDDATIAFGEIRSPQTLENLSANPYVEVNFVDPLSRRGFRVKGMATIAPCGTDLYRQHEENFQEWPTLMARIGNIILISIEETRVLTSPVYDDGATEAELRQQWSNRLCGSSSRN